jgi:serine/threonine protein kinase
MDDGVVGILRASQPIEFGSVIANKYTVLRPEVGSSTGLFVCREAGIDELRSLWLNHPRHSLDPSGDQFLAELTKVAKLEHPQLRKLLDFGRDPSGILYAVYEPLELRNLSDVLEHDWPLANERIVWLMCQLLSALEVAHAAGITHGDLRPENVLVRAAGTVSQNEEILLCGLGLAGSARFTFVNRESRPHLQLTEWMVGTPPFAAPEQFRGEPRDARSDVYGAGLLLFQLLTRTPPFLAANELDTAWMQCFTPPPPPSGYAHVSPALEAVCLKALTKTPDVRYQSANEMRAALLEAQARGAHSGRVRLSRTSQVPTAAPVAGSSRKSTPSIVPAVVVANRRSEPGSALARPSVRTATVEMPAVRDSQRRKPSASLLLACSTLAIAAAVVLPDLKLRERDADTIVRAEPGEARPFEELAELPPIELPARKPARLAEDTPEALAASPRIKSVLQPSAARVAAAPTAAAPVSAAPTVVAPRRVEPARARVRTIDKSVLAADASEGAKLHAPIAMAMVSGAEVTAEAPAEPPAALPVLEVEAAAADPSAASTPKPSAATTIQAEAQAPVAEVTSAPAEVLPRPVVFATTAPKAPAPSSSAHDVTVAIGDVTSSRGAVSKVALRGAFNQSALARCYREAVQSGNQPARSTNAEIEFSTNMAGRVTAARVANANLSPNLARCVEEAARLGRVREADTGELRATVTVSFFVH